MFLACMTVSPPVHQSIVSARIIMKICSQISLTMMRVYFILFMFVSVFDKMCSAVDIRYRLQKVDGPLTRYTFSGVGLTQVEYPCFQCIGEPCMPQLFHCLADIVVRELEEQHELLKFLETIASTLREMHGAQEELLTFIKAASKSSRVKRRHARKYVEVL